MAKITQFITQADRRLMFSTGYITKRGNCTGVIEVNYFNLGIPVITSVFLRIVETNQYRKITSKVKGKLEADILRDITAYETLCEEADREVYGDVLMADSELTIQEYKSF